ncbi:MAG: hypothetical protein ACK5LC_14885 [Coprobacillaceae bacterium]
MENRKIVIVDDDKKFTAVLEEEVKKIFNDQEIITFNLYDKSYVDKNEIFLLLLDIEILDENGGLAFNGIDEAIKIRDNKKWDIEIIFITSHSDLITAAQDAVPFYFISKDNVCDIFFCQSRFQFMVDYYFDIVALSVLLSM